MTTGRHVELARITAGKISPADFVVCDGNTTHPTHDQRVTVRASMFGLNAGLRTRLGTGKSTTLGPALGIGDTPQSDAIGIVLASNRPGMLVGDTVVGLLPWSHVSDVDGQQLRVLDPSADPVKHLTILGHVGLTAYVGLITIGQLARGETVWIPAAAGGVGSCAVQIAQRVGATVIASAAGDDRVGFLRDCLGVEHPVDRLQDLKSQIESHAPDGLDVYFDLVGGDHLSTAVEMMRERGRIVIAGRAGNHSSTVVWPDSAELIRRRLSLIGMSVTDHPEAHQALADFVAARDLERPLVSAATIHRGLDSLPDAFCALFSGGINGRGLVDVRNDVLHPSSTETIRPSRRTP